MRKILWIIVLVFILPSVVMAQYSDVATGGNGGANDSIGVDTDDDGTFESYLYPAFLQKGSNITLTVAGDTLTIAGPASGGTADSMGVDTDGDGTVDNYLYSTTVGAFHLKKGTNITMTVAGDTVEIAGPSASGTADSMGVDTDGDGTMDNYLYSTVAGAFHLTEKTGMTLLVQGDTLLLSTTLGTTILSNEIFDQTIIKDDIDSTASNVVFDNAYEGTSAEADSQYSTHNWVQVEIGDSLGGYIDSASIHDSLDVVRAEMGDSATTVRLDEIQDPSGDKTFTMGTNDLEFSYTAPTTNAFEINLAGGFSGDGFHVHQHTGNPGTTNMVVFEAEDADVMALRVAHTGRDTLSVFTGGLSQFDSVDVNGVFRVDGALNFIDNAIADSMLSADQINHTLDSAEVYLIMRDSLGGTATRTDDYVLKIDTDPTPDSFYWAVAGAGDGIDSADVMVIIRDTTYVDSALVGVIIFDSLTTDIYPVKASPAPVDDYVLKIDTDTDPDSFYFAEDAGASSGLDSAEVMTILRDTTYVDSALVGQIISDSTVAGGMDSAEVMIVIRDSTYIDSALTGVVVRDTADLLYMPIGSNDLDSAEVMVIIRDTTYIDSALTGVVVRDTADLLYAPIALSLSDSLVLNSGDVITGTYDLNGVTELKMPNGGAAEVDAVSEISFDVTDHEMFSNDGTNDFVYGAKIKSRSFVILDIAVGHDFPLWQTPRPIIITKISGVTDASTVTGQLKEYDGVGANPTDTQAGDTTFDTGEDENTTFSNPGIDAGDWLGWETVSLGGTVNIFSVTVEYYEQ